MNSQSLEELSSYIGKQADDLQPMIIYYSDLILTLELSVKIRYKIPFFDHKSWVCYINPLRTKAIELAFLHGKEISNQNGLLQDRGRKQIAGIELTKIRQYPDHQILEILQEALLLDELKSQTKKKKNRLN